MTWKCPQDGTDIPDDTHACALCGYVRVPGGVRLTHETSGRFLEVRVDTTVGRAAFRRFEDPDDRFVGPEQFRLEKNVALGGWIVHGIAWATNPLWVNGVPVGADGVLLRMGDRLSIKDRYFRLIVALLP